MIFYHTGVQHMDTVADISMKLLGGIALASGFGGISYQLWRLPEDARLPLSKWFGAFVISAISGVVTYLWLVDDFTGSMPKLWAISLLAGTGGTVFMDVALDRLGAKLKKALK